MGAPLGIAKRAFCFKTRFVLCFASKNSILKAGKTLKQNIAKLSKTSVLLYPAIPSCRMLPELTSPLTAAGTRPLRRSRCARAQNAGTFVSHCLSRRRRRLCSRRRPPLITQYRTPTPSIFFCTLARTIDAPYFCFLC